MSATTIKKKCVGPSCEVPKLFVRFRKKKISIEIFIEVLSIKFCANLSRGVLSYVCGEQDREIERKMDGRT